MGFNYLEILINITLASFGGLVKRLTELEKNPTMKITLESYMARAFISMFVGIIVYFICKNFDVSQFLTAGLTALGGYMGTPLLDLFSEIAKKRVKEKFNYDDSENQM